ncbi:phage holin family protein [Schinkia azotoformans]|uniref:phage holin family protein n=1 Tax=Schinkia azotoformans TaxID=1454 RepID=UPI002DBCC8D7|nr:phage holin family protein [Schinkia azotoformans]MEC1744095.1 phage holin family protein [Schinkia azotoformans]
MEKFFISSIGGFLSWLVGGWSLLLTVLLILNVFDFGTGMAANWGNISSQKGFKGIIKKGLMWVWVAIANLIYMVLADQGLTVGQVIPDAVAVMFILNEVISLGENSAKLGVSVPEPIQRALAIFQKNIEQKEKESSK